MNIKIANGLKKINEDTKNTNITRIQERNEITFRGLKTKNVHLGTGKSEMVSWIGKLRQAFLVHLGCRILIEIGFFYILYVIAARSNSFDKDIAGQVSPKSTVSSD